MAKIVTNTSPLIKLHQISSLDILLKVYKEVWTSDFIHESEILFPEEVVNFKDLYVKKKKPSDLHLDAALKKFEKLDQGEITCAALYGEGGYDELLMANKDAEKAFIKSGINVRNVLELAYIAVQKSLYDEQTAKIFVQEMSKIYAPTKRVIKIFQDKGFGFLIE